MLTVVDHQTEYAPLPEVYQVELTAACDLRCPMCLRTTSMERKPKLLDPKLIEDMHARGEFACTSFIELQQAGEPTIHPELGNIIRFLHEKPKLLVGMSTHGLNFTKPDVIRACLELDALTISIDSVDPDTYHKLRYPATLDRLYASLDLFFDAWNKDYTSLWVRRPVVDLQLIKTPLAETSGDIAALQRVIEKRGWLSTYADCRNRLRIRTQRDDFEEMDGRAIVGSHPRPVHGQLCLNPFSSVSVNCDGDVVSCCMIFDPHRGNPNWYGNLKEQTLAEIWYGPRVAALRVAHRAGGKLPAQCAKCYCWSPTVIHQNIVRGILAAGR